MHWGQHPLRPEFLESTYFLHRATGDDHYLYVGKTVLKALQQYTRVPCGYVFMLSVFGIDLQIHQFKLNLSDLRLAAISWKSFNVVRIWARLEIFGPIAITRSPFPEGMQRPYNTTVTAQKKDPHAPIPSSKAHFTCLLSYAYTITQFWALPQAKFNKPFTNWNRFLFVIRYAAVNDVRTRVHEDRMDSFVLAETFKYLYMMFGEDRDLPVQLQDYVLTTEAHFLPLSLATAGRNTSYFTLKIDDDDEDKYKKWVWFDIGMV